MRCLINVERRIEAFVWLSSALIECELFIAASLAAITSVIVAFGSVIHGIALPISNAIPLLDVTELRIDDRLSLCWVDAVETEGAVLARTV